MISSAARCLTPSGSPSPQIGPAAPTCAVRQCCHCRKHATHQMVTDCEAPESVFLENIPAAADVAIVLQSFVDLEVVAPTGQLQAIDPTR